VFTAAAIRKGIEPRTFVRKFDFHKAVGKQLTFSRNPHRKYSEGAPANLIDGVRGPKVFKSIEWTAWHGKPVDLMIDMAETQPYSSVTLGMLTDKPSHIFFPTKIAVAVSEDGENYTEIAAQEYELEGKDDPDGTKDFTVSFAETSARYLKVTVEPTAAMPEWHHKKGGATFIFLDEIIVR
jgi:hexosaminidase